MKKFGSRISPLAFLIFALFTLLTIATYMIWIITSVWWPSLVLTIIDIFIVYPVYFGTNYRLDKDKIIINCGLFFVNYKIAYQDIMAVIPKKDSSFAPCLDTQRVLIMYIKQGKSHKIFVSPNMFDEFVCLITDNVLSFAKEGEKENQDASDTKLATSENKPTKSRKEKTNVAEVKKSEKSKSLTKVRTRKASPKKTQSRSKTNTSKASKENTSVKKVKTAT